MDYLNRKKIREENWICRYVGCKRNLYHFFPFYNPRTKYCQQHRDELKKYKWEKQKIKSKLKNMAYHRKHCKWCDVLFKATKKQKFCSTKCAQKWHKKESYRKRKIIRWKNKIDRPYLFCSQCGNKINMGLVHKQFCSGKCRNRFGRKKHLLPKKYIPKSV